MNLILSATEVRILGCLIEKQATTPDVYPLTLNSVQAACNQKSNRDPVTDLDTTEVMTAIDGLIAKNLASTYQSERNRMPKYQHKLHQRLFDEFNFSLPQLAVLCPLFLRGPQTLGEIRTRCSRIHQFASLDGLVSVLEELQEDPNGPYVTMLARRAGHKESRYAHLFCGEVNELAVPDSQAVAGSAAPSTDVARLELEVSALREELANLERRFDKFVEQFE